MKDTIVEAVIEQLNSRSKIGIKKYGVTLDRTDLSTLEWMVHFREELQDGLLYLERIIQDTQKEQKEKLESHTYHTDKNGCYNKKKENWYDEKLEERINIIGQNGNEGTHYNK
jgi:hypothetical protein